MAKVKKRTSVTGVRNVKASKKASGRKAVSKSSRSGIAKGTKAGQRKPIGKSKATMKRPSKNSKTRSNARLVAPAPVVRVVVKPLEPTAKCGAGTSVQYLFRVDETVDGRTTTHLVFFDRHGWYCEHGRNCPAVGHAKKYQGHMARAS